MKIIMRIIDRLRGVITCENCHRKVDRRWFFEDSDGCPLNVHIVGVFYVMRGDVQFVPTLGA